MAEEKEIGSLGVKIGLDGSSFQAGVGAIKTQLAVVKSELRATTAQIGEFGNKTDLQKAKADSFAKQIGLQRQVVNTLNEAYIKSVDAKGKDAKATQDLEIKINNAKTALANMENELKKTNTAVTTHTGLVKTMGSSYTGAISPVKAMITAITGVIATVGIMKTVIAGVNFDAKMEQAKVAFETLLHSADAANKMLGDLFKFAADTPFEFPGVQDTAKKLLGMGFSATQVLPALSAMGNAVAAIGGNQDTLNGVSLALGQMLTKGKISAEEMNQLAERGIGAWSIMAQQMGKSTAELMKMAQNGKLLASEGLPALLNGMAEKYAGAMEKQSLTFNGLMSTLKDNIQMALGGATAGLFDRLKTTMVDLTAKMAQFTQDGTLKKWGKELGDTLVNAFNIAVKVGKELLSIATVIKENWGLIGPILIGVTTGFAGLKIISVVTALLAPFRVAMLAAAASGTTFMAALGPVGWTIIGISVAMGVVAASTNVFGTNTKGAADETFRFANSLGEVNKKLAESPMKRTGDDVKNLQSDIGKINELLKERAVLETKVAEAKVRADKSGEYGQSAANANLKEQKTALREVQDQLKIYGIDASNAKQVIESLNVQVDKSVAGLLELKKAEIAEIGAKVQHIDKMEVLNKKYTELSSAQKLDQSQKAQLLSVVNQLKQEYPAIISLMDKDGKIQITNTGILNDRITAEKNFVSTSAEGLKTYLTNLQTSTKLQAGEMLKQVQSLSKLQKAYEAISDPFGNGSKAPSWMTETTKGLFGLDQKFAAGNVNNDLKKKSEEYNKVATSLNDIELALSKVTKGDFTIDDPYAGLGGDGGGTGEDLAKKAADARKKAYDAELEIAKFKAQFYNQTAAQQIAALNLVASHHKQHLKEDIGDEHAYLLEVKKLREDGVKQSEKTNKDKFDDSKRQIAAKKELNQLSEKDELTAWKRVSDQYEANSDEKIEADKNYYKLKADMDKTAKDNAVKAADDMDKEIIKALKDKYDQERTIQVRANEQSVQDEDNASHKRMEAYDDEHAAKIKLLDDASYSQTKAIQDQIQALDDQVRDQENIVKNHEFEVKKAELEAKLNAVSNAKEIADAKQKLLSATSEQQFRAVDAQAEYEDAIANANSPEERVKAQQVLNNRLLGLGQDVATAKSQLNTQTALDAANKASTQTELDSLVSNHNIDLQKQANDKLKESLQDQIEAIRKKTEDAKALEDDQYSHQKRNEEDGLTSFKQNLDKEKTALNDHYDALTKDDALAAEARKLALDTNQTELITLLGTYNPQWQNAGQSFGESLLTGLNSTKVNIQTAIADILAGVGKAKTAQAGLNVAQGLAGGITLGLTNVKGAGVALAGAAVGAIVGTLKIKSPSQVTTELGQHTGQGFINGMSNMISKIKEQARQFATAALPGSTRFSGSSDASSSSTSGKGGITQILQFAAGAIQINASDIKSMQDLISLFERLPQANRAR